MNGSGVLAEALLVSADTCYCLPGYPVTTLTEATGAERTVNEKVALEYAIGDSLAGRRSAVILKNVGLNACADTLVNATTQGVRGGVVVIAGDDLGVLASQNRQDSRNYAAVADVPVFDARERGAGGIVEAAFRASERFSRVAIIRATSTFLESEVSGEIAEPERHFGEVAGWQLTMRGRVEAAAIRTQEMADWAESRGHVIVSPPCCLDLPGDEPETMQKRGYSRTFCSGCPFLPALSVLKEKGIRVISDIGCSVLATNPPYETAIAAYSLGSSVAIAAHSTGVALTGDGALLHSGINALIDVYEKRRPLLCIVLRNNVMAMTGRQETPDVLRYISWADPETIASDDIRTIREAIYIPDRPRTLVITGRCPEGAGYESIEY